MAAVPALSNTHDFLKSLLPFFLFFKLFFCRSLDVWIGFNDFASSGAQQRGEGFNLESCQNWLPGEPHPSNADHCVRMGPTGQCNTDLCMAKHSYVCEYKPQGGLCLPCWAPRLGSCPLSGTAVHVGRGSSRASPQNECDLRQYSETQLPETQIQLKRKSLSYSNICREQKERQEQYSEAMHWK